MFGGTNSKIEINAWIKTSPWCTVCVGRIIKSGYLRPLFAIARGDRQSF